MARWNPGADDRLRQAALELFLARGFENVTVADITERAGLTRRTFFRYFADKREVLFAGSERLPGAVADAVREADATLPPAEAVRHALTAVGTQLVEHVVRARDRRTVIAASPELQERERTKMAAVADAIATGLRHRGVADGAADLLAQVGTAIFQVAFTRWVDQDGATTFPDCLHEVDVELRSLMREEP